MTFRLTYPQQGHFDGWYQKLLLMRPYNYFHAWEFRDTSTFNVHIDTNLAENGHLPGALNPRSLLPNLDNRRYNMDTWHKVEIYFKHSTTLTSRDGIIRIWMNNILVMEHLNANLEGPYYDTWFYNVWDATSPSPAIPESVDYGHIFVAVGDGSGGGTTPAVASLSPSAPHVIVNTNVTMTVGLNQAVAGNQVVTLLSSDPTKVTVPSSVTVLNAQSLASFNATGVAVGTSTVSAVLNGSVAQVVTVEPTLPQGGGDVYDYAEQFSGTQGQDCWWYLEEDGTQLTFADYQWSGRATYQLLWQGGGHPGAPGAGAKTVLRWKAPKAGDITITGQVWDASVNIGVGDGVTCEILKNGVLQDTLTVVEGNSAGLPLNHQFTVATNDTIDFRLGGRVTYNNDSTGLTPVITYAGTLQTHYVTLAAAVTGTGLVTQARQAIQMVLAALATSVPTLSRARTAYRALAGLSHAIAIHSRSFLQMVTHSIPLTARAVGSVVTSIHIPLESVARIAARWLLLFGGHG